MITNVSSVIIQAYISHLTNDDIYIYTNQPIHCKFKGQLYRQLYYLMF